MGANGHIKHRQPLGVVIPAYGHPGFLPEAIISACEQKCDQPVIVVVVDDGCRFAETRDVVASLQILYPGVLYYFRQCNTRLPGARNAGVRFLLDLYPDMDAIFFLDADNRIEDYSLQNYRMALGDDAAIGWAYPDISFFGLSWGEQGFDTRETAPTYSKLRHLAGNISEAGSLVRADVFRRGLFYDEEMKQGLEDWDYWLTLLEAGYTGVRAPQSGFLYRRRPESMLAASQRGVENTLYKIRQKHAALYNPKALMQLEHEEDPVFAVYVAGDDSVRLTGDPALEGKRISLNDFKEQVALKLHHEHEYTLPDYIFVMTQEAVARWQNIGRYQRYCLWKIREFCGVSTHINHPDMVAVQLPFEGVAVSDPANLGAIVITQRALKQAMRQATPLDCKAAEKLVIPVPAVWGGTEAGRIEASPGGAQEALDHLLQSLRTESVWSQHLTRQYSGPAPINIRHRLMTDICAAPEYFPYPACSGKARDVFVMCAGDISPGGHVHSGLSSMVQKALGAGKEVGIVLERGFGKKALPRWGLIDQVTDVAVIDIAERSNTTRRYMSHDIPQVLTTQQNTQFSVLMRSADKVVFTGRSSALEMAGELRSYATEIYVCDVGNTSDKIRYLAYEHVIDRLMCESIEDADGLAAMGFPAEKILIYHDDV